MLVECADCTTPRSLAAGQVYHGVPGVPGRNDELVVFVVRPGMSNVQARL